MLKRRNIQIMYHLLMSQTYVFVGVTNSIILCLLIITWVSVLSMQICCLDTSRDWLVINWPSKEENVDNNVPEQMQNGYS